MSESQAVVDTARDYYNSSDADTFYERVWGGDDIHIGLYESEAESIADASRRTVQRMLGRVSDGPSRPRVLDLGSGYCGAARQIARELDATVVAVNLAEVENQRARELNRKAGLGDRITVIDGSFESLPSSDDAFDIAWSQDALLHSGARDKVLSEVARVLAPGGHFVFTDPMQADDCPSGVLQPILDRIHLRDLGSPAYYRDKAREVGLEEVAFEDHTAQLIEHYSRVLEQTRSRFDELSKDIDPGYLDRMQTGLRHWIEGGRAGHLAWGIFHFRRAG
jgi:sarcosine/dimethylglycine N-methyltransferase